MKNWSYNKKVKGATKVEAYGLKFDSKLELYMYDLLLDSGISFEFQTTFELQPKFKSSTGKTVRAITWRPDFVIEGYNIVVDTKGYATDVAKLKVKMFMKQNNHWLFLVKNKKQANDFVLLLKNNKFKEMANLDSAL